MHNKIKHIKNYNKNIITWDELLINFSNSVVNNKLIKVRNPGFFISHNADEIEKIKPIMKKLKVNTAHLYMNIAISIQVVAVVGAETVLSGLTVIVPVASTAPQPPVKGIVQLNGLPVEIEGVPLIVITPVEALKEAFTPVGKPVGVPIPVAPVVVWVKGVRGVLIHNEVVVGLETVFVGFTVIVPVALTVPQPPVKGIV